jgi:hypothetical protein
VDLDDVASWVDSSCAAQGVPVRLEDPVVIERVAVLLGVGGESVAQSQVGRDSRGVP